MNLEEPNKIALVLPAFGLRETQMDITSAACSSASILVHNFLGDTRTSNFFRLNYVADVIIVKANTNMEDRIVLRFVPDGQVCECSAELKNNKLLTIS